MNTALASNLGALQAQIYWLHDAENFDELAFVVSKIYEILGHNKERAEIAGRLISEAYQLADKAESASKAGEIAKEMQFYSQAKEKLRQAESSLGFLVSTAEHQVKWWMYFRHKNMLLVVIHLFCQHFKPLGLKDCLAAIPLTYYLIQVGIGHNKRDLEMTRKGSTSYWMLLLNTNSRGYPFLG